MPMKNDREYRNMVLEVRDLQEDERKIVVGYASTFDEPYTLYEDGDWRFDEVVDANAFTNTDMSDVIMQYDHEGRVFARISNNTLSLNVDDRGLLIDANLGGTELGRGLYEDIQGGYITKMSFGFVVDEDEIALDVVSIGCSVRLYDVEFEEEVEYQIVGSTEADSLNFKISNESPVGSALIGRKVGETVEVETQVGEILFRILGIQRNGRRLHDTAISQTR
jgi:HK97 family phage prohead protease